nr:MAG TPA: hypothetical protein [Caudoviricetes sp.]
MAGQLLDREGGFAHSAGQTMALLKNAIAGGCYVV